MCLLVREDLFNKRDSVSKRHFHLTEAASLAAFGPYHLSPLPLSCLVTLNGLILSDFAFELGVPGIPLGTERHKSKQNSLWAGMNRDPPLAVLDGAGRLSGDVVVQHCQL